MISHLTPATRPFGIAGTLAALLLAACTASSSPSASATAQPSGSQSVPASASTGPSATGEPTVEPTASASAEPTDGLPDFSCVPTLGLAGTTARATITDLRVGTHDGYDRIVFEFVDGIPAFVVEAALPPFYQDASGLPIDVEGTAFLKVTMTGASIANEDGELVYDGPQEFSPGFPRLVHLIGGGDFEAVSTWYIGLDGGACMRLLTVGDDRVVIDIAQ